MATIKFTATKLANTGKKGILKPDENGYYTMVIGGLNTFNSVGEYYTLEGAKELFEASSSLMRNIQSGSLKGELGHPKKLPGMSTDEYIKRVLTVEETNISHHIKEVWLDESFGRQHPELKNPTLVAIMAKVRPSGIKASALQTALESPDENVWFSIRALTQDYYNRGQTFRVLKTIVTWDHVHYGGISTANKWQSPALESLEELPVSLKSLERVLEDSMQDVAMESSRLILTEGIERMRSDLRLVTLPHLYAKW